MTYNLTPLFVEPWQWTGQPRNQWPAWVDSAVGTVMGTQVLIAATILFVEQPMGVVQPVAPDWWLIKLPDDTVEVMTPLQYSARVQTTPIYQAPSPPVTTPPVVTPPVSPNNPLPPKPYTPQDHITTLVTASAGTVLKQYTDVDGRHVLGFTAPDPATLASDVILLLDVTAGDMDLLRFGAADGKFYIGKLSTWNQWNA